MESQDAVENPLEANEPEKRHHAVNSVIWTPLMLQSLIEGLLEQVHLGRRVEGAFKTQAYNAVLPQVQAHVQQEGLDGGLLQLTRDKLRTKVSWLKRLWEAWQAMLNEPQFSRDHETGKLVAAEGVWNNYLKDRSSMYRFLRTNAMPHEDLCAELFEDVHPQAPRVGSTRTSRPQTRNQTQNQNQEAQPTHHTEPSSPNIPQRPLSSSPSTPTIATATATPQKRRREWDGGVDFEAINDDMRSKRVEKTAVQQALEILFKDYSEEDIEWLDKAAKQLTNGANAEIWLAAGVKRDQLMRLWIYSSASKPLDVT